MNEMPEVSLRRRRSRVEIEQIVKTYEQSGLTRLAFCAQHGLSVATLDKYRQRCKTKTRPQAESSTIVPLELVRSCSSMMSAAAPDSARMYVELARGRRIAVSCGFDATTLMRLVAALEEA